MIAVFKREFKACFTSIIGWLFMAVILALFGLYFFVYNLLSGYPYISYTLSSMAFLVLLAVPVLTMRILSEDRRNKTDQLMLTSPVSVIKIVLGKYLALGALYTLCMLIICITPLVLSQYGTVPMGESYTAILGFWLFGMACIAVRLFFSGITESQIIAAVTTFVALFIGYMMPNLCSLISSSGNIITRILSCYDLYSPMGPFMAGTLDLTCVVYFITLIAVMIFLTIQLIEKRRWSMNVHRIGLGVFSVTTIVAVIAAAVLINFGVKKIPVEYTSIDATYNKMFALSDETRSYVKALDQDVTIYVWGSRNLTDTTLNETLDRFADSSSHIKVNFITPSENPTFYTAFTTEAPADNSLIVVSDKRSRIVNYEDVYVYSYDYQTYSRNIDAYDAEGQIVSAIEYVTMANDMMPKVCVLEGHDEVALGESFNTALTKANITPETLNLLKADSVPADCQLLIINGAVSDLSKDDVDKISAYIANGGNVLLTTSYDAGEQKNLEAFLSSYGITKEAGIVMDYDTGHVYSNIGYYLLPEVLDCEYTSQISNGYIFAPFASGLTINEDDFNYDYTTILATSDKAKAVSVGEDGSVDENGTTVDGPFALGVAVRRADEAGTLVVFGSIDIFNDDADSIVAGSNKNLFNGIVSTHVNESEMDLPVIPAKSYTVGNLVLTSLTGAIVGLIIMLLLPIAMIATGIAIWGSRRKR